MPVVLQKPIRQAGNPPWRVPYGVKVAFFWFSCVLAAAFAGHQTHKRLFLGRLHVQALLQPTVFHNTKAPVVTAQIGNTEQKMPLAATGEKWVLVHFWATWCKTCRAEMATLYRLSEHLAGKLDVLAVSVDTNWESVEAFFASHGEMRWRDSRFPLLWDPQRQAANRYGVKRFPESFLVSPSGFVHVGFAGARDWSQGVAVRYLQGIIKQGGL